MNEQNNDKDVVVLGGAGYLGSVLTARLLDQGHRVTVFDALRFGDAHLESLRRRPGFNLIRGDIRHIEAVTDCIKDTQAVILLASLVGEPACDHDPKETADINFLATKAVAEACRYYQVPRFIFASTDSAYGIQEGIMYEDSPMNPISLYGRLKVDSEAAIMAMEDESFKPTVLRMATIYGLSPRMRFDLVVNILTLNACLNEKITVHGGAQWRPLVHVADAAKAYAMCLDAPISTVGGQIFNVGSNGQNYQIGQLGEEVRSVIPEIEVETIPQSPDLRDYYVSFDKITNTLGYKVDYSIADGVREIRRALTDGTIPDPKDSRHYNVIGTS